MGVVGEREDQLPVAAFDERRWILTPRGHGQVPVLVAGVYQES